MNSPSDSLARLQDIMRDVFDNDSIVLTSEMTAKDVAEWDSMNHVRLIVALEQDLGFELPMERVSELRNVGELVELLDESRG